MNKKLLVTVFSAITLAIIVAAGAHGIFWFFKTSAVKKQTLAIIATNDKISSANVSVSGYPLKQKILIDNLKFETGEILSDYEVFNGYIINIKKFEAQASIFDNEFEVTKFSEVSFLGDDDQSGYVEFAQKPKIKFSFDKNMLTKISYRDSGYKIIDEKSETVLYEGGSASVEFTAKLSGKNIKHKISANFDDISGIEIFDSSRFAKPEQTLPNIEEETHTVNIATNSKLETNNTENVAISGDINVEKQDIDSVNIDNEQPNIAIQNPENKNKIADIADGEQKQNEIAQNQAIQSEQDKQNDQKQILENNNIAPEEQNKVENSLNNKDNKKQEALTQTDGLKKDTDEAKNEVQAQVKNQINENVNSEIVQQNSQPQPQEQKKEELETLALANPKLPKKEEDDKSNETLPVLNLDGSEPVKTEQNEKIADESDIDNKPAIIDPINQNSDSANEEVSNSNINQEAQEIVKQKQPKQKEKKVAKKSDIDIFDNSLNKKSIILEVSYILSADKKSNKLLLSSVEIETLEFSSPFYTIMINGNYNPEEEGEERIDLTLKIDKFNNVITYIKKATAHIKKANSPLQDINETIEVNEIVQNNIIEQNQVNDKGQEVENVTKNPDTKQEIMPANDQNVTQIESQENNSKPITQLIVIQNPDELSLSSIITDLAQQNPNSKESVAIFHIKSTENEDVMINKTSFSNLMALALPVILELMGELVETF